MLTVFSMCSLNHYYIAINLRGVHPRICKIPLGNNMLMGKPENIQSDGTKYWYDNPSHATELVIARQNNQ